MNYRHGYHAGNLADVVKHAVFAFVLRYMAEKEAPFAVLDTHAGAGVYDLRSGLALDTGEWIEGVGRLYDRDLSPALSTFLGPWIETVERFNPDGRLAHYPGSPEIAHVALRPQDRLTLCELHPMDFATLHARYGRDMRIKTMATDGWLAPKAHLPPREKRGVILIDPPFEQPGDHDRLVEALRQGLKRFSNGVFLLWRPIKDPEAGRRFRRAIAAIGHPKTLMIDAQWRVMDGARLSGSGLTAVNAPYTLRPAIEAAARDFERLTGASLTVAAP